MIYSDKIAIEVASLLLKVNAIQLKSKNYFTWASGWKSPIYCDNRILLGYPAERQTVSNSFSQLIKDKFPSSNALSGVATAGIAHGAFVAQELELPYSYVRSSAKAHGKKNQIEGFIKEGSKIVVIEDLISTGGSTIKAIEALQIYGYEVIGAVAVFTYGFDKAVEAFENINIPFYTLSSYEFLLQLLENENKLTAKEKEKLAQWRVDPAGWSV